MTCRFGRSGYANHVLSEKTLPFPNWIVNTGYPGFNVIATANNRDKG
ncbi:MAG: hypothetical protein ACLTZT_16710 [Butyricimonas faecalis]